MDLNNGGTETQMINNLANKPRPPPQILKPKPSLPKKPAIAAKPGKLSEKSSSFNEQNPLPSTKPSVKEETTLHNSHDSPKASPPRTITPHPKGPPPPLPKTAPKGASAQKTPPALPKHPPRASLKNSEKCGKDLKLDNDDEPRLSDLESEVLPEQKTSTNSNAKNEIPSSDCDKTPENISSEGNSDNDSENFTFANLKSKFLSSESSTKPISKVPEKPKPSSKAKPVINKNTDCHENDETNSNNVTTVSGIHFLKEHGKSTGDSTVWFNKAIVSPKNSPKSSPRNSPRNSPILPRKPPPRVTLKPKSVCDPNPVSDNEKTFSASSSVHSSPEKTSTESSGNTFHVVKNKDKKDVVVHDKEIKNDDMNNSPEKTKPKGSPKPLPKPVPRKPVPTARPRPTPRKRLSINRLSGSDETFDIIVSGDSSNMQENGTVSDNKITSVGDAKQNTFVVEPSEKANQESDEQNVPAARKMKDSVNDAKRNTFVIETSENASSDSFEQKQTVDMEAKSGYVEEEVEYRVIEKHARSQSHITELDSATDDHQVILRTKVVKEENLDEGEELTLEELTSIGYLLESSDDEDHDKFMRRMETPVENEEINMKNPREKTNVEPNIVKRDYNEMLDDKSILEPSSLLNEIEDILTRSFKHSSLTRSGSSPEKKSSPYLNGGEACKTGRSHSVDIHSSDTPVRPPRPKKEQKRLRSMSHTLCDSCGSDTESLPDLSRNKDDTGHSTNVSLTLGKAKPHPPKPKRHKLLKVQRSQSDVTSMKSVVDKMDANDSKSPRQNHVKHESKRSGNVSNEMKNKQSPYKKRPTRKAPEPPKGPTLKAPSSSRVSLDTVVPLDVRVKSMSLDSKDAMKNKRECMSIMTPGGAFYHSINDDFGSSDDDDHDYQDISDDNVKLNKVETNSPRQGHMTKGYKNSKSVSPPKLPPRNMNTSHSFDNSSLSSTGHDLDSVITSAVSSNEDMSISSSCFEQDINSPGLKNPLILRTTYPKTSSPYVKGRTYTKSDENINSSGLGPSNSSLSDCLDNRKLRPVSGCSIQSDSWSGSAGAEQSSSDSEIDDEEKISRKREKKLFMIAQEITSSEHVFVDVLKLLNVDFRLHVTSATEKLGRPIIPTETLNRILDYLPQLEIFNEGLLKDLEERISKWEEKKCISDIFVKKGPFLKLYSSYIRDFETITSTLDEALKKYPQFQACVKDFEMSPKCASLALKHYMLKPIQRIPQYRLLLQDYMKHLPPDCPEMKDMQTALAIVSEVAHHANENMRREDYVQKMLEIQRSLIGQFEVIKPGRLFLKEGELKKISRKEMQPRYFFLFNDVLLYTTPVATGYRLNNVLPLAGMKVSVAAQDEYKMEFSIISVQRSFTLHGTTLEERDDWVTALNAAIEENALKRNTFEAVRAGAQGFDFEALLDKDFVLGHKAPLWIPDARVTMCMLCTCEFTVTWRRHHCRACGWVVCGNCSEGKAPLRYLKYKLARVCDKCFKTLSEEAEKKAKENPEKDESLNKDEDESGNSLSLNGLLERFQKIRRSGRSDKKNTVRPDRLKEVSATDQDASMSGYLQKWHKGKKWKKKQWFLVRDKVLYTFKASQDTAAASSMVLLGYEVSRFNDYYEGVEAELLFQLSHANTEPVVFRTDSATATEKWVSVMRESTVA